MPAATIGSAATPPAAAATVAPANGTPGLATAGPLATQAAASTESSSEATPTANPTLEAGLVGLWQGDNGSFYLFNSDGTWNWDQRRDQVLINPENQGRWWLDGAGFNIQDLIGKEACPRAQIGAYQAGLDGDSLMLVLIKDPCIVRTGQTTGHYARLPAGP